MIEGFKSLIKIALAILSHIAQVYEERGLTSEVFADTLKHFNDELRPESHNLLTQACNFKVTSKLMADLERLYNNENRTNN